MKDLIAQFKSSASFPAALKDARFEGKSLTEICTETGASWVKYTYGELAIWSPDWRVATAGWGGADLIIRMPPPRDFAPLPIEAVRGKGWQVAGQMFTNYNAAEVAAGVSVGTLFL